MKKIWKMSIHKLVSYVLTVAMICTLIPTAAFAAEETVTHTAECTYVEAVEGHDCEYVHEHNEECGYVEAIAEIPCDMECIDIDEDGEIDHDSDCAYTPEVAGSPCTDVHEHDADCGYVEAVEGVDCDCVVDEEIDKEIDEEIDNTIVDEDEVNDNEANTTEPICICETMCWTDDDVANSNCPVCADNILNCTGEDMTVQDFSVFSILEDSYENESKKTIQLGINGLSNPSTETSNTAWIGDKVYFGVAHQTNSTTTDAQPMLYEVLNIAETDFGSNTLFLYSDVTLKATVQYDKTTYDAWADSDLKTYFNYYFYEEATSATSNYYGASLSSVYTPLTTAEQAAVHLSTKASENASNGGTHTTNVYGYSTQYMPVSSDTFFPLDESELTTEKYGFVNAATKVGSTKTDFWLRSYFYYSNGGGLYQPAKVAGSGSTGNVSALNYSSYDRMRPAVNLTKENILLTTPAEASVGGKSSSVSSALSTTTEATVSEWKMTLLDSSNDFAVTESTLTASPSEEITLTYTNADTSYDTGYISAMIADSADNVLYYGLLSSSYNENGTVTVTIPSDISNGSYTLSVFNEDIKGDMYSDYSSAFSKIALTIDENDGYTEAPFTVTTTLDDKDADATEEYRSGETVTATVTVSASELTEYQTTTVGSFNMELVYDSDYLTLGTITAGDDFAGMSYNTTESTTKVFFSSDSVEVAYGAEITLFTVTYTVIDDVSTDSTEVGVDGVDVTPEGVNGNNSDITVENDTAKIIDTVTISVEAGDNGSIASTDDIVVDSGATYADAYSKLPTATASTNYTFVGWYKDGTTLLTDDDTFTTDVTIKATFAPSSFDFKTSLTDASISTTSGVTSSKVTYMTDVKFTVTASDNYVINTVSYQVGSETAVTLTADSGVYTIPGVKITDDITVYVSAVPYYTITFSATNATLEGATTLYAKSGTSGLYESVTALEAGTTTASVPTPTASTGYRLADVVWNDGTNNVSATTIAETVFTTNTTYTVNTVKTYDIGFESADATMGTVATTSDGTYDTGASVTLPTATANPGYEFVNWTLDSVEVTGESVTATADAIYKANFKASTFTVTFPTVAGVTFTTTGGLTDGNKVTYGGDDVTFKVAATGVQIDSVSYTVGGTPTAITADGNGVYTIPNSAIVGNVSITVTSTMLHTVTFVSGDNGSVGGTTSFNVTTGGTLSDYGAVTTTAVTGYEFDGWYIGTTKYDSITSETVTADVTYTAKFVQIQYTISGLDGYTIVYVSGYTGGDAVYGTDVTFTITKDIGEVITGVSLNGTELTAVDGVYTIPGTMFTGATALTLTVTDLTGATMTFIDLDLEYKAAVSEAKDRKIMVMTVSSDTNDTTYALADGTTLYWSDLYKAYVRIVDDSETAASLSYGMTSTSGAAKALVYDGDLNGDGEVRSDDAGILHDILSNTRAVATTDLQMLQSDLKGVKYMSTNDITEIMNTYFNS